MVILNDYTGAKEIALEVNEIFSQEEIEKYTGIDQLTVIAALIPLQF
jgi:hypothetical protein